MSVHLHSIKIIVHSTSPLLSSHFVFGPLLPLARHSEGCGTSSKPLTFGPAYARNKEGAHDDCGFTSLTVVERHVQNLWVLDSILLVEPLKFWSSLIYAVIALPFYVIDKKYFWLRPERKNCAFRKAAQMRKKRKAKCVFFCEAHGTRSWRE